MKGKILTKVTLLAALMCASVTGCKFNKNKLKLVEDDPYTFTSNHRNLRINGNGYSAEQYTDNTKTLKDGTVGHNYVISDVKALVVPIDFEDYPASIFGSEENSLGLIRNAVFGEKSDTKWYSLKEYYASSSFGQCKITGTVLPWYRYNKKVSEIDKTKTATSTDIATKIQDYYREHPEIVNLADYDANKDGYVDSLIMIYSAPINPGKAGDSGLWWAYCWSIPGAWGKYTPAGDMIGVSRYFWASMHFLFDKGQNKYATAAEIATGTLKPDSHTLVHEFGHVLSLPDYYITDYSATDYAALGGLDMMDYNIGDHNIYSKMMYGWVNPRRVTGTKGKVTVDLKSATTTGDAIIIPAPGEWNDTYLDQYLTIEFLTPEGVAESDGKAPYVEGWSKYYGTAGIRILHIDSRMGSFSSSSFLGYSWTTTRQDKSSYIDIAADNTASRSAFSAYKLAEIMPATGKYQRQRQRDADDSCLYKEGDSFGMNGIFEDFKFNSIDGTVTKEFGFKIHVDKINGNESATITISR